MIYFEQQRIGVQITNLVHNTNKVLPYGMGSPFRSVVPTEDTMMFIFMFPKYGIGIPVKNKIKYSMSLLN